MIDGSKFIISFFLIKKIKNKAKLNGDQKSLVIPTKPKKTSVNIK